MRIALAVLGVVLLSVGCYRATGQLAVSTAAVPELMGTNHVTVPVPEHDSVVLNHRFDSERLVVCATRQVACEDRETRTYRRTEVVERKLPWHHWLVLGGGVVLGGAGAYLWADSGGRIASGEDIAIGNPSQEMAYDEGKRDIAIGVGLVVGGGLLLASEVADLLMARDDARPLPDLSETTLLLRRTCGQEPVGNDALHAQGASGTRVEWRTDSTGCVSVGVLSEAMSGMPYAEPFVTVRREGSEELAIALPAPLSARLVAERRRSLEIDEWLSKHEDSPEAGIVRQARAELLRAEAEEQALACKKAYANAQASLNGEAPANLLKYGARGDIEGAEADLAVLRSGKCGSCISASQFEDLDRLLETRKASHDKANLKLEAELRLVAPLSANME